jgi:MoxR-like ATPase
MDIETAFRNICQACAEYPSLKGGLPMGDPKAKETVLQLRIIQRWLMEQFNTFEGVPIRAVISEGAGAFPRVPWICLLPPDQKVNDGIYVGMCFGKQGNGAVVGCMQSATSPKGLQTQERAGEGKTPAVDVDGVSTGTKYNNVFANPLEVFSDTFDPSAMAQHIENSLKIAMEKLRVLPINVLDYSTKILDALTNATNSSLSFLIQPDKSRNAAGCLTAALCHRLSTSGYNTSPVSGTTFKWNEGVINLRNAIRSQPEFWTNLTIDYATGVHQSSQGKAFVYLMSLWAPGSPEIDVWAIPEFLVYEAFQRLPQGQTLDKKSIRINRDNHIIENDPAIENFSEYHRKLKLFDRELNELRNANEVDLRVRQFRQSQRRDETEEQFDDDMISGDVSSAVENIEGNSTYDLQDALEGLFMSGEELSAVLDTWRVKKNAILQGPPGVGKTFVAKRLAYLLMGVIDRTRVEMIQFHQSYSYEDFVQGWRPKEEGGFYLKNGVFYSFCRRASQDALQQPYVFIIDEINRGNLSRILGELMMLIEPEQRGEESAMPLTYSQSHTDTFYIPRNVYVLGMMNTADRSLAIVDYALRRRFFFTTLRPAFATSQFKSLLLERGIAEDLLSRIIDCMTTLNEEIVADKNLGAGFEIGHSFFCPSDQRLVLDWSWYESIIQREIAPLIREYWFDDLEKAEQKIATLLT